MVIRRMLDLLATARFVVGEIVWLCVERAVGLPKPARIALGGMAVAVALVSGFVIITQRSPDSWRRESPTPDQIGYARTLGIAVEDGISKGELADRIKNAKESRKDAD